MSDKLHGVLAASEEHSRSVIAAMSEGVILLAADTTILACNESAERMLGLGAEQMAGRSTYDSRWRTIRPDGTPFPAEEHPAVIALHTGVPQRGVEMGVHKPDGTLSWISINAQPLFRDGETTAHAVVTTFSDVTDRKRNEIELKQSQEHYRSIVETSAEGIWTIDAEGRTVFANERMAAMLHCTSEELHASSLWDFIPVEEQEKVRGEFDTCFNGVDEGREACFVTKDGTRVWASLSAAPIALPNGGSGAMAMVRDVTAQKRVLDEMNEARRLEAIGRLAGGIAHDFNNLLTAILTAVSLAERSPQALSQYLKMIQAAGERAAALTKQLLAFARKQTIQAEPVYIGKLVCGMEEVLCRLVGERIRVLLDVEPDAWAALADASQIEWVVLSLASNARDAMPEGGELCVTTRMVTLDELQRPGEPTVLAGDYVRLTVHDTGPGMDEVTRRHIFEPFFSTKGHARGLGLASCYGIIKQLGGHIRAHSGETHGTTFEILLKRALELPKRAEEGARSERSAGGATVLLAEDDELVRSSLTRALRDQGYVVLAAEDGRAALALAAQYGSAIDLLISDVVMPRLGGFELAKRLRQTRPELPILFVSGYSDQRPPLSDGTKAPTRFLEKPYTLNELAKTVTELLAQARSQRTSSAPAQR